jgi:uncharacterized protein YciI
MVDLYKAHHEAHHEAHTSPLTSLQRLLTQGRHKAVKGTEWVCEEQRGAHTLLEALVEALVEGP